MDRSLSEQLALEHLLGQGEPEVRTTGEWQSAARLIEAAKRSNRLRRATIKVVGEGRANKKLLYAQASKALRSEIQAINKQFQQERTALYAEHSRRTWADWLKKEAQHGGADGHGKAEPVTELHLVDQPHSPNHDRAYEEF